MLFFGTLCSLEPRELSNKLLRLYQFKHSVTATAYEFIPDINRVLTKYELIAFRDDYLNSGLFPRQVSVEKNFKTTCTFTGTTKLVRTIVNMF